MYSNHSLTLDGVTIQLVHITTAGGIRGYVKIAEPDYYNGKDSLAVSGTPEELEHLAGLLVEAARLIREQSAAVPA